jgi:hypothetical protein
VSNLNGTYDFDLARRLRRCKGISHTTYRIAAELLDRENSHQVAWPSVRRLAKDAAMGRTAAHRALQTLKDLDVIGIAKLSALHRAGLIPELDGRPTQQSQGYLINHQWQPARPSEADGHRPLERTGPSFSEDTTVRPEGTKQHTDNTTPTDVSSELTRAPKRAYWSEAQERVIVDGRLMARWRADYGPMGIDVDALLLKFSNYCAANPGKYADYHQAFVSWLNRENLHTDHASRRPIKATLRPAESATSYDQVGQHF